MAMWRARGSGLRVAGLVNFFDQASERVRFHATRRELIQAQADALRLELFQRGTTPDNFPQIVAETMAGLRAAGFAGIIYGNIHLQDVRASCAAFSAAAGLEHVEPLWHVPSAVLIREFVAAGFQAVITCVETPKLGPEWLGRQIDADFVRAILGQSGVDACGENGEFHSFTWAGPTFHNALSWRAGQRRISPDGQFAQMDIVQDRASCLAAPVNGQRTA